MEQDSGACPNLNRLLQSLTVNEDDLQWSNPRGAAYRAQSRQIDGYYDSGEVSNFYANDADSESLSDCDSYSICSDYSDICQWPVLDRKVIIHPTKSAYIRKYPAYDVFSGQSMIDNGYIPSEDVDMIDGTGSASNK